MAATDGEGAPCSDSDCGRRESRRGCRSTTWPGGSSARSRSRRCRSTSVGRPQPPPRRLSEIAAALNVRTSALLTEPAVDIRWEAFRKLAKLSKARQERVTAVAAQRLESEFRLRAMFHFDERHDLPGPIAVRELADCDYAAATLRMRWNLGDRPVDNLVGLIEERGGAVLTWPEAWGFDGLSGWAGSTPVLVLNAQPPPDRRRFNAAHELGHLVMKSTGDERQDERFAHRFAASFLVPAEAARRELGAHRRNLSIDELGLLKQRWGLSMQGWIRRARDLGDHQRGSLPDVEHGVSSQGLAPQGAGPVQGERVAVVVPPARAASPGRGRDHVRRSGTPVPGRLRDGRACPGGRDVAPRPRAAAA